MINRYFGGATPYPSHLAARKPADDAIQNQGQAGIAEFGRLVDDYQFSRALETAWSLVGSVNKYLVEEEPWVVAEKEGEQNKARLGTMLYPAAEALRIVTALGHPVLPESTDKIWRQLGLGDIARFNLAELKWGQLPLGGKLGKVEPVFPRADKTAIERMQQMEQERTTPAPAVTSTTPAAGEAAPRKQPAAPAAPPAAVPQAAAAPDGKITIDDILN